MSKRKIFGEIPQEISENIKAPETAPSDKRISGRTKQLNFKVREEFYWQLKNKAVEEKCMMVEVLERAFVEYERNRESSENFSSSELHHIKCYHPNCEKEATATRTQSHLPNKEAGEFCSEHMKYKYDLPFNNCSFFTHDEQDNLITCDKPLFDKKKQLCRSHNKQVWARFNKFLKEKKPSVSGTATWLGIWEDSGDWKYFWDLERKNRVR